MRIGAIVACLVAISAPLPAYADAATHDLQLQATTVPGSQYDGLSCKLSGTLRAMKETSNDIDVVFYVGSPNPDLQGEAILSFHKVRSDARSSASVEIGGGSCNQLNIRRVRARCPKDKRFDSVYTCKNFTNIQLHRLTSPSLNAIKADEVGTPNMAAR